MEDKSAVPNIKDVGEKGMRKNEESFGSMHCP